MIRFEAAYTEQMPADAARTYIRRRLPWRPALAAVVLTWGSAATLAWSGDRGWLLGVFASVPLMAMLVAVAAWWAQLEQSRAKLRRMAPPLAQFAMGPDGLDIESNLGRAFVPWATVTEVWVCPGFWMLFTAPNSYNIVPTATMPPDAEALARSHVPVVSCG